MTESPSEPLINELIMTGDVVKTLPATKSIHQF